jgi:predicted cobalt transporter CbtA
MKPLTFILISLGSGALAGLILAGLNLFVVEPYIDTAIGLETSKAIDSGENVFTNEQNLYRIWQKWTSFVAGSILGMAFGSLLGIVYMFSHKAIPFSSDRKKAVFLSLVMCLVLFVVPFIKYPGNPPAVGNSDTIWLRESLYLGILAISTLSALLLGILSYRLKYVPKISAIMPLFYVGIISVAFVLLPSNPDEISISMDLVNSFRIMSGLTMIGFWLSLGVIFGMLWHKFKPNESSKITAM